MISCLLTSSIIFYRSFYFFQNLLASFQESKDSVKVIPFIFLLFLSLLLFYYYIKVMVSAFVKIILSDQDGEQFLYFSK